MPSTACSRPSFLDARSNISASKDLRGLRGRDGQRENGGCGGESKKWEGKGEKKGAKGRDGKSEKMGSKWYGEIG